MSTFKRYRESPALEKPDIFTSGISIDKSNFVELFSAGIGWSTVTQKRAGDSVVRGRDWYIDFETGLLMFGSERYPFQVIGTESYATNTWLWGWSNNSIENDETLRLSEILMRFGDENNLEALYEPQFELSQVYNGFSLSSVAALISKTPGCVYRCPHETGAVFVIFELVPRDVFAPIQIDVFVPTVMHLAQQTVSDHKLLVEGFLFYNQTPFFYEDGSLIAEFPKQAPLAINFDQFHRITAIESKK